MVVKYSLFCVLLMGHTFLSQPRLPITFTTYSLIKTCIHDETDHLFELHHRHTDGGEPHRHYLENQARHRAGCPHRRLPYHRPSLTERSFALFHTDLSVFQRGNQGTGWTQPTLRAPQPRTGTPAALLPPSFRPCGKGQRDRWDR